MRTIVTVVVGMVVISPCLLILSGSDDFKPNLGGFLWLMILCIVGRTKVGIWAINQVVQANKNIERWLFN